MIANLDGIVGPTHNYAGLSHGNVASLASGGAVSNPREAALQGLAKARFVADLGLHQGVLPPHERPHVPSLRRLGFSGSDAEIVAQAAREEPALLAAFSSAAAMWTANAATVTPSAASRDGRVHITPANLAAKLHRAIEPPTTATALRAIFHDSSRYAHHDPLPRHPRLGDEGAANHMSLTGISGEPGLEVFVHGGAGDPDVARHTRRFAPRQSLAASQAIARLHGLREDHVAFAQQNPDAIDAGVFHNDVIAVSDGSLLLCHEDAFCDLEALAAQCTRAVGSAFRLRVVIRREVSLEDAVRSYLFNAQLLTARGERWLLVPTECREIAPVSRTLDAFLDEGVVQHVQVLDVRESMRNGGGPACLRLRVPLADELEGTHPGIWLTDALHAALEAWVKRHYRDRLEPADLADPLLLEESRAALDALTGLLGLGSIYDFQRA